MLRKFLLSFRWRSSNVAIFLLLVPGCEIPGSDVYFCKDAAYPYWCSVSKKCCPYGFHKDDTNLCYQTMASCVADGGTCETCAIEANNPLLKTLNQNDGTYNWSLSNVNGVNSSCFSCAFIVNNELTIDGTYLGPISVDGFGNLTFHGPCPNGSSAQGTFTGTRGGSTFRSWQGTWSCADGSTGGSASIWKLFQN